jgi:Cu(I)/Ag(I) efflux system periplasmic protein CusF
MRVLLAGMTMSLFMSIAAAETVPVKGEVTKINEPQNKLTLKHEPIPNLDMDSMTMVFTVADPAMLKAVQVGDKVVFEADRVNGRITVTRIERAD